MHNMMPNRGKVSSWKTNKNKITEIGMKHMLPAELKQVQWGCINADMKADKQEGGYEAHEKSRIWLSLFVWRIYNPAQPKLMQKRVCLISVFTVCSRLKPTYIWTYNNAQTHMQTHGGTHTHTSCTQPEAICFAMFDMCCFDLIWKTTLFQQDLICVSLVLRRAWGLILAV